MLVIRRPFAFWLSFVVARNAYPAFVHCIVSVAFLTHDELAFLLFAFRVVRKPKRVYRVALMGYDFELECSFSVVLVVGQANGSDVAAVSRVSHSEINVDKPITPLALGGPLAGYCCVEFHRYFFEDKLATYSNVSALSS